jgi:uncharacterized protein (TIGR02594 family)
MTAAFDPIKPIKMLPDKYAWLANESGPKIITEWLKIYGTKEVPGSGNNPEIMSWAKELGITWYTEDSIPWCGLGMGIVAHRAGKELPKELLRAKSWAEFGTAVAPENASFGDTLVFSRKGGGHVGTYIGESTKTYHVLGANQGDAISIVEIQKSRLFAVRRPIYSEQPANVRKIIIDASGKISEDEA